MNLPAVEPPDRKAVAEAVAELNAKTKPLGSLGLLETLAKKLAGIQGTTRPSVEPAIVFVFAGDHGVTEENVSAYPQVVTRQMVENILKGGAAISVLSKSAGLDLRVFDVGVAGGELDVEGLQRQRVRGGTRNFAQEPAMTRAECESAMQTGINASRKASKEGYKCIVMGEMGIGNSSAAATLVSAICGIDPQKTVGPGTGVAGEALLRKRRVVASSLARVSTHDPLECLIQFGGYEICALVGAMIGAAAERTAAIVDGVISGAAALVACKLCPAAQDYLFFGHLSPEPGHALLLEEIGEEPVLRLEMRLGEGTGGALAYSILRAATVILGEMATFESANVSRGPAHGGD